MDDAHLDAWTRRCDVTAGETVDRGGSPRHSYRRSPMRHSTLLVRPVCALAFLALLAGAVGVRPDTAREDPLAGITIAALDSFAPTEAAGDARHARAQRHREHRPRHRSRGRQVGAATHRQASGGNSAATITGSFTEACRDFSARSSKDISHVEVHYGDGRVVKDESTRTPVYGIDGGPGDEIDFVKVKSGTTTETFTCPRTNGPPTALLEILTPDAECGMFFESGLRCDAQPAPRIVWRSSSDFPNEPGSYSSQEAGHLLWLCDSSAGDCSELSFVVRGTGSSDPDNDLVSWSITFDDGTSASGTWTTDPPADVQHKFEIDHFSCGATLAFHCVVTLTVTDAAGQSDTDTITMGFVDTTPD
jgi:hypothetical protein